MAFLTNLDRKLSEIGQGALKKTKDVSDTMRISSAIKDEENRQMDIFRQIGSYYYRTYASQADGQMKVWCDSITASQAVVKQYQDQLTILKGVAFCPNCNAEVSLTSAFCHNCGAKMVAKPPVSPINTGKVCPSCGVSLSEGQLFCTNCGSRVPEISMESVIQEVRKCGNCGSELAEGQMFCTNCGSRYEEQPAGLTSKGSEMPVKSEAGSMSLTPKADEVQDKQEAAGYDTMWTPDTETAAEGSSVQQVARCCPNCGKELGEGLLFCTNCGAKL